MITTKTPAPSKINPAITANFPPKFAPFFQPKRIKVAYGGRGGAKSWSIARALLLIGQQYPIRILCAREHMQSMQDSVWKLLVDQINELGLNSFYYIEKQGITGKPVKLIDANGITKIKHTEFLFAGIATNVQKIRSFENANICWVEEAANITKHSLDILEPTIRGEGYIPGTPAEIWYSYNPDSPDDAVHNRYVLTDDPDALVVKMNYYDNPWCPQTLIKLAEKTKEKNIEEYRWIFEGEPRRHLEGAVYANEIRQAEEQNRICDVPYDSSVGVSVFFDLGYADSTAIWFAQKVGFETHLIDYYEARQETLDHYLKVISDKPYAIDRYFLPHDAKAKQLGTGKSIEEMLRAKGKQVSVVPKLDLSDGINAVRMNFPVMFFDKTKCAEGLMHIRNYHFEKGSDGSWKDTPHHDKHSHANDCLRYVCTALKATKPKPDSKYFGPTRQNRFAGNTSWMSI